MHIGIIGSYGAGNIGDEALLDQTIIATRPYASLYTLFSGNPQHTQSRYPSYTCVSHLPCGLRSLFSVQAWKALLALKRCDILLFGGGGLFTDEYTYYAPFLWWLHTLYARMLGIPYIFVSNSFSPMKTWITTTMMVSAITHAKGVLVRDSISYEVVKQYIPHAIQGEDLVLTLPITPRSEHTQKNIAFNARTSRFHHESLAKTLKKKQENGKSIVFIVFEEDDKNIHATYYNFLPCIQPQSIQEAIHELSFFEEAYMMRLHGIFASILASCKVFGLAYAKKCEGVCKDYDIPYAFPAENVLFEEAKNISHEPIGKKKTVLQNFLHTYLS